MVAGDSEENSHGKNGEGDEEKTEALPVEGDERRPIGTNDDRCASESALRDISD